MSADLRRWVIRSAPASPGGVSGDILRWVWRCASSNVITGKMCFGTITMTIPGAVISMAIPGAAMQMTIPVAVIEFEDCT